MEVVRKSLTEISETHLDNEMLSKLPPPPSMALVSSRGIKNKRRAMEDKLVYLHNVNTLYNTKSNHDAAYYAIFDGHNGPAVAAYAVAHLHQFLLESASYPHDVTMAFREAYAKVDENIVKKVRRRFFSIKTKIGMYLPFFWAKVLVRHINSWE